MNYDYFDENNEFNTNEYDDKNVTLKDLENTLSIPMDVSMELISEWNKKGKLVLDPDFQRRYVWDNKKMSLFIESLMLGIPIPSILFAEDKKQNKYIVIDGKQRLNSIIKFIASENQGKGFKLTGLEILKNLNGCTYQKLQTKGEFSQYLARFEDAILKCSIVKNYTEDQLYFIFNRLNTGSVPLSTQELRQSLYPGKFLSYINEFSMNNENLMKVLGIKTPDKRMKDVELVVRYFSFKYYLQQYPNNLNKFFNKTCELLNSQWDSNSNKIIVDCQELNNSIRFVYEKLGDDAAFRAYFINKETLTGQFGPINRPMFDLMSVFFSIPENRLKVNSNNINLKQFVISLFQNNTKFSNAFLPTTHSKEKTDARFQEFEKEFKKL